MKRTRTNASAGLTDKPRAAGFTQLQSLSHGPSAFCRFLQQELEDALAHKDDVSASVTVSVLQRAVASSCFPREEFSKRVTQSSAPT